ncbi:MAG: hypothetical protein U0236_08175 [Nitrospira sp.]
MDRDSPETSVLRSEISVPRGPDRFYSQAFDKKGNTQMKMLLIVARAIMLNELQEFLDRSAVVNYAILKNVRGKGITGRGYGPFLNPEANVIIGSILPPDQADRAISALKTFHTRQKEAAHDNNPIPLKVFSFPCQEHL